MTEDEIDSITDSMDLNLSKLWERLKDRKAWRAAVHGVSKSQTRLSDSTTTTGYITYKDLLYNRGNYTQHFIITY